MANEKIVSLAKLAKQTFSNPTITKNNLLNLKSKIDQIRSIDINLDKNFSCPDYWIDNAPVSYISVYKNDSFTMSVFVLGPNQNNIPLHNHPQMHGLLKVIMGKVKIESYSYTDKIQNNSLIYVEKNKDLILDENSEAAFLEPRYGNIHQITSCDGPAAFLDILSPPYDNETRPCNYYKILENPTSDNLYGLIEIPSPDWFYTSLELYTGPKINL